MHYTSVNKTLWVNFDTNPAQHVVLYHDGRGTVHYVWAMMPAKAMAVRLEPTYRDTLVHWR